MNTNGPTLAPPGLPEGWKAVWNDVHQEWFYVNAYTLESTWNRPSMAAKLSSNNNGAPDEPAQSFSSRPRSTHDTRNGAPSNGEVPVATSRNSHAAALQDDLAFEKEILSDFDFGESPSSIETSDAVTAWSRKSRCRVLIKRYSKSSPAQAAAAQRELNALHLLGGADDTIPPLLDQFDPANTIFMVSEDREGESLRRYIEGRGPLTGDLLKAIMTQLMSALSVIFMNGFAHLRMNDETLYIDHQTGQLTIKDFQYAVPYGLERVDNLYAPIGHTVQGNKGIWCAPEVFVAEKQNVDYNARSAVLWSCGIAIYYMVTGQLEKLSNLDHPANPGRRSSIMVANNTNNTTSDQTDTPNDPSSQRRFSLSAHRRRSSSAATASANPHSRKRSMTSFPTTQTFVQYPGNRLELPFYVREIISMMLILDPPRRAELIEVASKIPKTYSGKATRPLMELAWLDYKDHVGPYAGLRLAENQWKDDDTSSIYSGISELSQSFKGLLGKGSSTKKW